jgi:cobalt-zinc-cadmium efflux system outer membrane protein
MQIRFLAAVVGVGFMGLSAATMLADEPPKKALTLDQALKMASEKSPEAAIAQYETEAERARSRRTGRWPDPQLTAGVEDYPPGDGSLRDSKTMFGIEQTVPFPGKLKQERESSRLGVRRSEANLESRRIEIARSVKDAFAQVLAGKQMLAVSQELLTTAESSASAARKRVEAGAAGDQEALRAEIQLEQARAGLAEQERSLDRARTQLAFVVGDPEVRTMECEGALDDLAAVQDGNEVPGEHPSVAEARIGEAQSEAELKRARLEGYPDVTVGLEGGREGRDDTGLVQFRVSLPLPIFSRPGDRAREAKARVDSARAASELARQTLWRDREHARERLRGAAAQAQTYKTRILPKSEEALRLVRLGFDEGRFGMMDLLDTQRTAAETRLEYQKLLLEVALARNEWHALTRKYSRHVEKKAGETVKTNK